MNKLLKICVALLRVLAKIILLVIAVNTRAFADTTNVPAICIANRSVPILPTVTVNGQPKQIWAVCKKNNVFWLPKEIFTQHGVDDFSGYKMFELKGQRFVAINQKSKALHWDEQTQSIAINLSPNRFRITKNNLLSAEIPSGTKPESSNGAFFNYNLSSSSLSGSGGHYTTASGEIGVFTHSYGFFRQTGIYTPNSLNTSYSDSGTGDDSTPQWLRLDTTWRKDNRYKSSTLELGDSTTDAAHWGGSVNFAGLSLSLIHI